jgi:hypothetical protein
MNSNKKLDVSEAVIGVLAGLALMTLAMFLMAFIDGWAISTLWRWFVVPVFDVPTLTYAQSYGIGLLVGMVTNHPNYTKKSQGEVFTDAFLQLSIPLLAVLMGSIVVTFFM